MTAPETAEFTPGVVAGSGSHDRLVSEIVIPSRPPPGVVEALRNFVEAIEAYGETGVWPDNGTLRRLADEGRDALNCGHSANKDCATEV